ncbi:hypothetical protein [Nonomuraea salmonea]|uniref:LysR family transcriptional regulator n=1 Tax=Nonomuraea salmonea TaxID=46181 RepID=A0ABV5NGE2_9ACTN
MSNTSTKVGHPLFTKGPGTVARTAAGRQLLPAARRGLGELTAGLDAARRIGSGAAAQHVADRMPPGLAAPASTPRSRSMSSGTGRTGGDTSKTPG